MSVTEENTKAEPRPPAFEVTFECGNCGDEWTECFASNTLVKRRTGDDSVTVNDASNFGQTEYVHCPTCELSREVHVEDRQPIGDGDDE